MVNWFIGLLPTHAAFHSGFKLEIEENYFDSFVTFMYPSSKYSGFETEGCFANVILTKFPPINEGQT